MECLACNRQIGSGELLTCSACRGTYHYSCVNITSALFREKQLELKCNWKCPSCNNITRRKTDNTPARSRVNNMMQDIDMSFTSETDVTNIVGDSQIIDTPTNFINQSAAIYDTESISLSKFRLILKQELHDMKLSITSEITQNVSSTLSQQINNAIIGIQGQISGNNETLKSKQNEINVQILSMDAKIQNLEKENRTLTTDIEKLRIKLDKETKSEDPINILSTKKIVLYGLQEYEDEDENQLIYRLSDIFYDIMRVNIEPYVEKVVRLGKRGYKRPIEIEFLSRRFTNNILDNKDYFYNTGLFIGEFKSAEEMKSFRELNQILWEYRKKGQHAFIRKNKLYVNGQEYIKPQDTQVEYTMVNENVVQNKSNSEELKASNTFR